jgi:adenylate kinase family enzyme
MNEFKNIILFGNHGAGEDIQADKIARQLNLFHLATDRLLRDEILRGTNMGKKIQEIMERNESAPNEIVYKLVIEARSAAKKAGFNGVLFDELPATRELALYFNAGQIQIDLVVCFNTKKMYVLEYYRDLKIPIVQVDALPIFDITKVISALLESSI